MAFSDTVSRRPVADRRVTRPSRAGLTAALLAVAAHAAADDPPTLRVGGLARVATDYIQRGYSKTDDRAALQLHANLTPTARGPLAGAYAGTWVNRVQLGEARWEAVPYVGWRRAVGRDWQVDGTIAGYLYDERFEAGGGRSAHYGEIYGAAHYGDWLSLRAGAAVAPYGIGGVAPEVEVKLRRPLSDVLMASLSVGHAWLGDFAGYEVTHAAVGVGWVLSRRLQADLRWHASTTANDDPSAPLHDLFERRLIDHRLVGALSISF